MGKIILTEKQIKEITKAIAQEEIQMIEENESNSRYAMRCNVQAEYYGGKTYKGGKINDITTSDIELTYDIDIEARSWGIKGISLYDIQGPSEIELEVDYYPNGDDSETETITIPLNWDNIEIEEEEGQGVVTINKDITLTLENDENGNLICNQINVTVYTL
jgi:hypothetical protein